MVFGLTVSYISRLRLLILCFTPIHFGRRGIRGEEKRLRVWRRNNLRPIFVRSRPPNTIQNQKGTKQHCDTRIACQNNQQRKQTRQEWPGNFTLSGQNWVVFQIVQKKIVISMASSFNQFELTLHNRLP